MKSSVDQLRSWMLARRHSIVVLAFVLCAWLMTAAAHLHFDDTKAGQPDPSLCAYCLAFSNGAVPLPEYRIPEVVAHALAVTAFLQTRGQAQLATTFYLSRGPPVK